MLHKYSMNIRVLTRKVQNSMLSHLCSLYSSSFLNKQIKLLFFGESILKHMDTLQNHENGRKLHNRAEVSYEPDPPVEDNKEIDQRRPVEQSRFLSHSGKIHHQIVTSQTPGHRLCAHRDCRMKRTAG